MLHVISKACFVPNVEKHAVFMYLVNCFPQCIVYWYWGSLALCKALSQCQWEGVNMSVCESESESESSVKHRLASYVHKSGRVEAHCSLLWPSRLCFHSGEASSAVVRLRPVCWNSRQGLNHPVTAVELPNVVIVYFLVIRFRWFKIAVIICDGKKWREYKR